MAVIKLSIVKKNNSIVHAVLKQTTKVLVHIRSQSWKALCESHTRHLVAMFRNLLLLGNELARKPLSNDYVLKLVMK